MKKILFILSILAMILFVSCEGLLNGDNGKDDDENPSISNNLSESNGTNELAGKTFEDASIRFTFDDTTVKTSKSSNASSSINARNSENDSIASSVFNYSFDTISSPKTLQFQLAGIFDGSNSEVESYDEQITTSKLKYDVLSTMLTTLLNGDALYSALSELGDEYVSKIKKSVKGKASDYISTQKSILNDYLKSKYESVIHFDYVLDSEKLILTEQFKGDLKSASAKFVGTFGDAIITLNDYDNVIPFKIEIPNEEGGWDVYIGLPKVEVATDTTGKISADMFSYPGNMLESSDDVITNISNNISDSIRDTLINILLAEDLDEIKSEFDSNDSSETVDAALNEVMGSYKFEVSYTISGNELNFVFTENGCPIFLQEYANSSFVDLTYTPLLGAIYSIVE